MANPAGGINGMAKLPAFYGVLSCLPCTELARIRRVNKTFYAVTTRPEAMAIILCKQDRSFGSEERVIALLRSDAVRVASGEIFPSLNDQAHCQMKEAQVEVLFEYGFSRVRDVNFFAITWIRCHKLMSGEAVVIETPSRKFPKAANAQRIAHITSGDQHTYVELAFQNRNRVPRYPENYGSSDESFVGAFSKWFLINPQIALPFSNFYMPEKEYDVGTYAPTGLTFHLLMFCDTKTVALAKCVNRSFQMICRDVFKERGDKIGDKITRTYIPEGELILPCREDRELRFLDPTAPPPHQSQLAFPHPKRPTKKPTRFTFVRAHGYLPIEED